MKSAVQHLEMAQRELEAVVQEMPAGSEWKEKLSVVNIYLLAALKCLDRLPKPQRDRL